MARRQLADARVSYEQENPGEAVVCWPGSEPSIGVEADDLLRADDCAPLSQAAELGHATFLKHKLVKMRFEEQRLREQYYDLQEQRWRMVSSLYGGEDLDAGSDSSACQSTSGDAEHSLSCPSSTA